MLVNRNISSRDLLFVCSFEDSPKPYTSKNRMRTFGIRNIIRKQTYEFLSLKPLPSSNSFYLLATTCCYHICTGDSAAQARAAGAGPGWPCTCSSFSNTSGKKIPALISVLPLLVWRERKREETPSAQWEQWGILDEGKKYRKHVKWEIVTDG